MDNRLRLKTSIDCIRWLTSQACAFRGHDESLGSKNHGNFIELVKLLASYNFKVNQVVLERAPKNAIYIAPTIQKEILQILANKVRKSIRQEIGDAKFCILVDEARDESRKEQMALVLTFVRKDGYVKERYFDFVHVKDTASQTLKDGLSNVLSQHALDIQNMRGQGYVGASNMRGEWNGLQALYLEECEYAYYIHCMAHRLQLALVAASKHVFPVYHFFSKFMLAINVTSSSCKRLEELRDAQVKELQELIALDELETGKGKNQIGTLQRPGETRWGSHFDSVCSLIRLYGPVCVVIEKITIQGSTYAQRADADGCLEAITSFEFVFILHLVREIMKMTNSLCEALQRRCQDSTNAMELVLITKKQIQEFREDGWDAFFEIIKLFCKKKEIEVLDMDAPYRRGRGRSIQQTDNITIEHHYRHDIFIVAIDSQLQELNAQFSDKATRLLMLSSNLVPKGGFRSFDISKICELAQDFYPRDFTVQEQINLECQLFQYKLRIFGHPDFQDLSTMSDLCRRLVETDKSSEFHLVDRLIRLVLTLPVSTATTERAFSAMKIVKTSLRNKMDDQFLADYLIVYIEKEIAEKFSSDLIIDDFSSLKPRRVQLCL